MTAVSQPGEDLAARDAAGSPAYQQMALVDVLDRVLATGVVVSGDITLSIADVDLVRISLRALIASVSAVAHADGGPLADEARR